MPEISHKDVVTALNGSNVSAAALEEAIKRVLAKGKQERIEAAQPKEPNWATMTEQDAYMSRMRTRLQLIFLQSSTKCLII